MSCFLSRSKISHFISDKKEKKKEKKKGKRENNPYLHFNRLEKKKQKRDFRETQK